MHCWWCGWKISQIDYLWSMKTNSMTHSFGRSQCPYKYWYTNKHMQKIRVFSKTVAQTHFQWSTCIVCCRFWHNNRKKNILIPKFLMCTQWKLHRFPPPLSIRQLSHLLIDQTANCFAEKNPIARQNQVQRNIKKQAWDLATCFTCAATYKKPLTCSAPLREISKETINTWIGAWLRQQKKSK